MSFRRRWRLRIIARCQSIMRRAIVINVVIIAVVVAVVWSFSAEAADGE